MSSPGSKSRNKGSSYERLFAKKLTEAGIPTRRVIGSGAHAVYDTRLRGDLQIGTGEAGGCLLVAEVKYRRGGAGFTTLEGWLAGSDVLILRRARADPLVTMQWDVFVELLSALWEKKK